MPVKKKRSREPQAKAKEGKKAKRGESYAQVPRLFPGSDGYLSLPDDGKLLFFTLRTWREMGATGANKLDPEELLERLPGWTKERLLVALGSLVDRNLALRDGRWLWDVEAYGNFVRNPNHHINAVRWLSKAPPDLRAAFDRRYPGIIEDGIRDGI